MEREEGVDSCGIPRGGAGFGLSLLAADGRVLHGRATLVRPGCPWLQRSRSGTASVVAAITRRSAEELALAEGDELTVLTKATDVVLGK